MTGQVKHIYEFGPFHLDATERVLLKNGQPMVLRPKTFDILLALVESSGHIVNKDELMQKVWPDSFVEEANLTQNISVLRKILSEGANNHQYIETIPKRGYRFAATVREVLDESEDILVETRSESRVIIEDQELTETMSQSRIEGKYGRRTQTLIRTAAAALLLAVAVGSVTIYLVSRPKELPLSIAVLPFKPLTTNLDDKALGIEMADALITRLSNIKPIAVKPTSSIRKYMETQPDPIQAGRELRVRYVLEGSLQRTDDRVRVSVQLLDTVEERPIWGDRFEKKFTDIFALQDSISEQVTRMLKQRLSGEDERLLTRRYTDNTEAYNSYMLGRYHYSKREMWKSVEQFKRALEVDQNYSLAWAGLARTLAMLGSSGFDVPPREILTSAKEAAERALELDDSIADAHTSMGIIKFHYLWDWPGAEAEFKRAMELSPQDPTAQYWYSIFLIAMNRVDDAIAECRRVEEADPVSITASLNVARALYYAGYYDRAIEQSKKALALSANSFLGHFILASAYRQKRMYEEAVTEFQQAKGTTNENLITIAAIATVYAKAGDKERAVKLLGEMREITGKKYVSPSYFASIYASLGDNDAALEWLEQAYEDRDNSLVNLRVEPLFETLHNDPRFHSLVKRVGLDK